MKGLIIMSNVEANSNNSGTRGPKVKKLDSSIADRIIKTIITFLQMFITETLAKRLVSMVLLSVGIPDSRVCELTGLSERGVRDLRKKLREGTADEELLHVGGGGKERKLKDIEQIIIDTIEKNDYHSQQEIADMIYKEHKIEVHRSTVSRMLKKTASSV
jgi:transposase